MALLKVVSEMAGMVNEIFVGVGQPIPAGATVVDIESMKMILPVVAEKAGVVREVLVGVGDSVDAGQAIISMEV